MNGVLAGLINLGIGGLMAAALVWFLHHLVTRTLPEANRIFREEVKAERELRWQEHQALLHMMDRLAKQQHEEHDALLAQVNTGLKELARLITESHVALERRLSPEQGPGTPPRQGPKPRPP